MDPLEWRQLVDARRESGITAVQPKLPTWFRGYLLRLFEELNLIEPDSNPDGFSNKSLLQHLHDLGHDWLVHTGQIKVGQRHDFVAEPFGLTDYQRQQVKDLADALGVKWCIEDRGWWDPARTVRVVMTEPGWQVYDDQFPSR